MALSWSVADVHNYEQVCFIEAREDDPSNGILKGDRILSPVTNALIWASISVELGGITQANAEKWYARLRIIERLNGPLLIRGQNHEGPPEITADEVAAHIGLSVNVTPVTDAKWSNKTIQYDIDRGTSIYRRASLAKAADAFAKDDAEAVST